MYTGHPDQYFGHISYSQNGEDLVLLNLFRNLGIDKPSYLDLGAHHPTTISNTALMYSRGCRGVNIEANPNLIGDFYKERPEDKNVCVGVADKEDDLAFFTFDERSGRNTFSEKEAIRFAELYAMPVKDIHLIACKTLNQIVDEYCGGIFPDFLNCDLEGLDFDVLSVTDFSKSRPKIICVEVSKLDLALIHDLMISNSFIPLEKMGDNVIFVNIEVLKERD